MNKLDQIQDIWLSQHNDQEKTNVNLILDQISKLDKKNKRMNLAKAISVISILAFLSFVVLNNLSLHTGLTGLGILVLSSLLMIFFNHHIRFRVKKADMMETQTDFIKNIRKDIQRFRINFLRLFSVFVVLVVVGINIIYFDILNENSQEQRLTAHIAITVFVMIAGWVGVRIRLKRTEKEFKPILNSLNQIAE